METQTIEQKLKEKVDQYESKVKSREPTLEEKRLEMWRRLLGNRRRVFGSSDTENRLSIIGHGKFDSISYVMADRYLWDSDNHDQRKVARKDFIDAFREKKAELYRQKSNPDVINEYESYLEEDKNTPYAPVPKTPISKVISNAYCSLIKELFPWRK